MPASAGEIAADVTARRARARSVCNAAIARAQALNPRLNALVALHADEALARADAIDAALGRGETVGPLAGVPVVVKDNICTRAGATTCGSAILAGYRSPFDATAVHRLEAAGAIIIGKANLDEFAMGSSTESGVAGPCRNPWDATRVSGGSSGGSAVSVAAGIAPLALGSDTGGSVRQPAALCGVLGLKPTWGRVSRYGLVAYASSLDQIGVIARTAEDAGLCLRAIAGADPADSTAALENVPDYVAALSAADRPARIGVPSEYFGDGLDGEVRAAVSEAISVFSRIGAVRVDVKLADTRSAIAAYYLVATAEASSNLARYDGVHYGRRTRTAAARGANATEHLYSASRDEGFGAEVKRRLMLGTFALSAGYADRYYLKALQVRRLIFEQFRAALEQCDLIVCPATPTPAFRIGESADPLQLYLADVYTVSANLAGVPALALPCGFTRAGLPIGVQLIAPWFGEAALLAAAAAYQRETDWHARRPPARGDGL